MAHTSCYILSIICRFYRLCVLCHSGSNRPFNISFAHYHWWGLVSIQTSDLIIISIIIINNHLFILEINILKYLNDFVNFELHIFPQHFSGDSQPLDVCSVHHGSALVRYSVSMLGYGFYGDVLAESEKHRWMGPLRYDYSGMDWWINYEKRDDCDCVCWIISDGFR